VSVRRVVLTGFSLWLAAWLVDGIDLAAGDALTATGTLLVFALLLTVVDGLTQGVRRLALAVQPVPLANAALFWTSAAVASAAGLGYAVSGLGPAIAGSLILLVVGWAFRAA
jgi:uncharacterized membrane protein YvlD (DUF360 family)